MFTKAALSSLPGKKRRVLRILGENNGFRWRSHEITRVEGLSDAVFAFAVTLLIVSLEVPKTYAELVHSLAGFFAFAACFAQLMVVWYHQYLYYRRYNLQDFASTALSMALLFVVLFYTYPLKFVFSTFLVPLGPHDPEPFTSVSEVRGMFMIYATGVVAVFGVFAWMYLHAYKMRHALNLSELECFDTLHTLREMFGYIAIALLSFVLAVTIPEDLLGLAGMAYGLTGAVFFAHGRWSGKRRRSLEERIDQMAEQAAVAA